MSVAAAFAMIALGLEAEAAEVEPLLAFLGSSSSCVVLPVALRLPVMATLLQSVATAALGLGVGWADTNTPALLVVSIGVLTAHVGLVALRHDWRLAVGAWWVLVGVAVLILAADDPAGATNRVMRLAVLGVGSLLVMLAGIAYRERARIREELAAARRDVALEHEQRTLVEERTRIARELHDVVAHSMSVIHMQATSAPYRLGDLDPAAREEFTAIAAGARQALREMRQLLGALRARDDEPEFEPAPGLAQLPKLVEATSRSGGPVTLEIGQDVGELPSTIGATVYRIVQEALSNVVRHAYGAATTVRLERERTVLTVTIVNSPGTRESVVAADEPHRARHGITGMRERVAIHGGELTHGPEPDGGFKVTARLPQPADTAGGNE